MLDLDPGDGSPSSAADVTDDASVRARSTPRPAASAASTSWSTTPASARPAPSADNPDEQWHRVFDVNVVGMVRVTRAALPYLRASEHAAIVNTCSIAAVAGLPQRALYSATKGAV